ncbi:MAG: ABC transporter substrate-binding protein [Pygmaiobacter sp.]
MEAVLAHTATETAHPSVLLLRASASGVKAKADDNLAGLILKDLGADNIASRHENLLEELSIEEIISEDPDYIFVVTMGADSEKAMASLAEGIGANPAWSDLSAVKNNRLIVLPKELFHYKPNAHWGESYEYLADILYPTT